MADLDLSKAIPVGLTNTEGITGRGKDIIATGIVAFSEKPTPLSGEVSIHTIFFGAFEKNADGSPVLTADGRMKPLIDSEGNPMIGPLLATWNPLAITVKNPAQLVGDPPEEGEPDTREPDNLTYLADGQPEENRVDVKVGAFIAGGGTSSETCMMAANAWGSYFGD